MTPSEQPKTFEQKVLEQLQNLNKSFIGLEANFTGLETKVTTLETQVSESLSQMQKWDDRLWTLTLAMITTIFAAIIGACGVIITRAL